jgi:molybdenum cofactor cytidylyltransferase
LVVHALDAAVKSGLAPVLLVVGHGGEAVRAAAPPSVEIVVADDWRLGISHSLRAALRSLQAHELDGHELDGREVEDREIGAVCIGLADQPLIGPDSYRRLAAAYDDGAAFAVATYHGRRGNPVLLGRGLWHDAELLNGDVGARALMATRAVVEVDCTDTGSPTDVDTLEDLHMLED